jgi:hypothetical protein
MRYIIALALCLLLAVSGDAQQITGWTVEPASEDNYIFRFVGRTLSSAGTPTVTAQYTTAADATPSAILGGTSVSGTDLIVRLKPDFGCGTSGCRNGNVYIIRVQPTDSDGNKPTATARFAVKWDDRSP